MERHFWMRTMIAKLIIRILDYCNFILTPASDPLLGSVKQYAAIRFPTARSGRYFFFCSLFPNKRIPLKPIDYKSNK